MNTKRDWHGASSLQRSMEHDLLVDGWRAIQIKEPLDLKINLHDGHAYKSVLHYHNYLLKAESMKI